MTQEKDGGGNIKKKIKPLFWPTIGGAVCAVQMYNTVLDTQFVFYKTFYK